MSKVRTISKEAAGEIFSSEEIARAQGSQDGLIGERDGVVYHINVELKDYRIPMGTVEMPDQQGEGRNFGTRRDNRDQ